MSSCSKDTVGTEVRTQAVGDAPAHTAGPWMIAEHIGPLIDSWMSIPNDLMSDLAMSNPVFVSRMNALIREIGTESK